MLENPPLNSPNPNVLTPQKDTSSTNSSSDFASADNHVSSNVVALAGVKGSLFQAVLAGKTNTDELVAIAKAEFGVDDMAAWSQVTELLSLRYSMRVASSDDFYESDGAVDSFGHSSASDVGRSRGSRSSSLSSAHLGSPEVELDSFRRSQFGFASSRKFRNLDDDVYRAVHGESGYLTGRDRNDVNSYMAGDRIVPVGFGNAYDSDEVYDENEAEELSSDQVLDMSRRVSGFNSGNKSVISMEEMTEGQRLARELLLRELGSGVGRNGSLDMWDPLVFLMDASYRDSVAKEIESISAFVVSPGTLTPPAKGRGRMLFARDSQLYRAMNDLILVVRGMTQVMALMLDSAGHHAVTKAAKLVVLASSVLSRLNAERIRIHYPRELADQVLRPRTEPIMRSEYRERAKEVAQEMRDAKLVSGSLFAKGGKGFTSRRSRFTPRRISKANIHPFPRREFRRKFVGTKSVQRPYREGAKFARK
jgi:hypothetical protein